MPVSASPTPNTWVQTSAGINTNPLPDNINGIVFSPNYAANHTVFAAASDGVYRSTDGGFNWSPAGLANDAVTSLAYSPVYAQSSEPLLVAATTAGVYASEDGGVGWTEITGDLVNTDIRVVSFSPDNVLFAGSNGLGLVKTSALNGGSTTWSLAGTELFSNHAVISSLAFSPAYASDRILFAGVDNGDMSGGVYFSNDGGLSFTAINTGLPEMLHRNVRALAISPNFGRDHTLFAGLYSGQGVYKSVDSGSTWTFLPDTAGLYVQALSISPDFARDGTLFVGEDGAGVFLTTNGGETWKAINTGFPAPDSITSLGIPSGQTGPSLTVFAGTHADRIWQMSYTHYTAYLPAILR